jgi:DNA-binding response OmpR family regulator
VRRKCLRDLHSDELVIKPVKISVLLGSIEKMLKKQNEEGGEEEEERKENVKKILIVEDDHFQSAILKNLLLQKGWEVVQAFSIREVDVVVLMIKREMKYLS